MVKTKKTGVISDYPTGQSIELLQSDPQHGSSNYARLNIDERLLIFLPHYKRLWLRNNPTYKGVLTEDMVPEAFLKTLSPFWVYEARDKTRRHGMVGADR